MSEQALHAYGKGFRNQKGVRNTNCKLSDEDVANIRELYKTGNYRYIDLGRKYRISGEHISRLIKNQQRSR